MRSSAFGLELPTSHKFLVALLLLRRNLTGSPSGQVRRYFQWVRVIKYSKRLLFFGFKILQSCTGLIRKSPILFENLLQGLLDPFPILVAILQRQLFIGANDPVGGIWFAAR